MIETVVDQLQEILEGNCIKEVKGNVIVYPTDTKQVSEVVKLAYEKGIKITVRKKPDDDVGKLDNRLVIDFRELTDYFEIDRENVTATVHTGITFNKFQSKLLEEGYYFPPVAIWDYDAFLVDVIGRNAVGLNSEKYGRWREFVLGMEVVLPTGEIIEIGGKIIKYASGLDLMGLFVGSQNSLGIITKVIVRLLPRPEARKLLVCGFDNINNAIEAVESLAHKGLEPVRKEVITPGLAEKMELPGIKDGQVAVLTEVEGFANSLKRQITQVEIIYNTFDLKSATLIEEDSEVFEIWKRYFIAANNFNGDNFLNITIIPTKFSELMKEIDNKTKELEIKFETIIHSRLVNMELILISSDDSKIKQFEEFILNKVRLLGGKVANKKIGISSHIAVIEALECGLRQLFDPKQIFMNGKGGV